MLKHWWQGLHWPEYGAELLGTAFLVFVGLSAVPLISALVRRWQAYFPIAAHADLLQDCCSREVDRWWRSRLWGS